MGCCAQLCKLHRQGLLDSPRMNLLESGQLEGSQLSRPVGWWGVGRERSYGCRPIVRVASPSNLHTCSATWQGAPPIHTIVRRVASLSNIHTKYPYLVRRGKPASNISIVHTQVLCRTLVASLVQKCVGRVPSLVKRMRVWHNRVMNRVPHATHHGSHFELERMRILNVMYE